MEKEVNFYSDGFKIFGTINVPDRINKGESIPAIVFSHGYGSSRNEFGVFSELANILNQKGILSLRFDHRGCGYSNYPLGKIIVNSNWKTDLMSAISFMNKYPGVDPERIGVIGLSMGAANVINTAAVDLRIKCVIAISPISDGFEWIKQNWIKNKNLDAFNTFLSNIEEDGYRLSIYGYSNLIKISDALAYDTKYTDLIEHLRLTVCVNIFTHYVQLASIDSIFSLKPIENIDKIAPRPILIMAGALDSAVPYIKNSEKLFKAAKESKKFVVYEKGDHSLLIEPIKTEAINEILLWLKKKL